MNTTHTILDPVCSRGHLLDRVLQGSFLDHVAVGVFNPSLVADRSQVFGQARARVSGRQNVSSLVRSDPSLSQSYS